MILLHAFCPRAAKARLQRRTPGQAGLFSAPGRTEIGGNHTDHQRGRVLAGSVNIDMIAAAAKHFLGGRGAVRVHGGGFAGTVQAFVPLDLLDSFKAGMEAILGKGRCHVLSIRPEGGAVL